MALTSLSSLLLCSFSFFHLILFNCQSPVVAAVSNSSQLLVHQFNTPVVAAVLNSNQLLVYQFNTPVVAAVLNSSQLLVYQFNTPVVVAVLNSSQLSIQLMKWQLFDAFRKIHKQFFLIGIYNAVIFLVCKNCKVVKQFNIFS